MKPLPWSTWRRIAPAMLIACALLIGAPARAQEQRQQTVKPYLLHLPGIGGHMRIDDLLTEGIKLGGLESEIRIYDWTNGNPGLPALGGYERNQAESQRIADVIAEVAKANPKRRIIITSHSGGGAMAAWALEKLPEDVQVDTLIMIAPALSPRYDLSRALRRVKGKAYAFTSTLDPIVGIGTKAMGTMDRVNTEAAGNVGFSFPETADPEQYKKLVPVPYTDAWLPLGNAGDHIGAMSGLFARVIFAPLLKTGELPTFNPATKPSRPTASPAANPTQAVPSPR